MKEQLVKDAAGAEVSRYRWETGALFEFDKDHNAYLFVATGNGKSKKATIREYEEWLSFGEDVRICDGCGQEFDFDDMTSTGGDEILCPECWADSVEDERIERKRWT